MLVSEFMACDGGEEFEPATAGCPLSRFSFRVFVSGALPDAAGFDDGLSALGAAAIRLLVLHGVSFLEAFLVVGLCGAGDSGDLLADESEPIVFVELVVHDLGETLFHACCCFHVGETWCEHVDKLLAFCCADDVFSLALGVPVFDGFFDHGCAGCWCADASGMVGVVVDGGAQLLVFDSFSCVFHFSEESAVGVGFWRLS